MIERLNPNCSEAVFRLEEPALDECREILQELLGISRSVLGSKYETHYNIIKRRIENAEELDDLTTISFPAINHDGEFGFSSEGDAVFRIGNNVLMDVEADFRWMKVKYGDRIHEAETDEETRKQARDCTCGIIFME